MKPPILSDEIRTKLWEKHPCSGKYSDDGELQCGAALPPIDFLRDDWNDLINAMAIHNRYLIQQAKAEVAREIFEEIDRLIERVGLDNTITIPVLDAKGYQSLKSKYGGQK
jgi:hypothetical protein